MIRITVVTDTSAEAAEVVAELRRLRLPACLDDTSASPDRQPAHRHLRAVGDQ